MSNKLAVELAEKLAVSGLTVAAAESCTAGRVATALTLVPGSSAYFQGSVVAYSNQMKVELLGVPVEVISRYGAVSEECAKAMAEGARRKMNVKAAVSTTGIAGPDGGSSHKPVGLVWLAVATDKGTISRQKQFSGDRNEICSAACDEALSLLLSTI